MCDGNVFSREKDFVNVKSCAAGCRSNSNYEYQYLGISTYYAENIGTIANDLKDIHADGFCAVPRVLEMIYDKLQAAGYIEIEKGYKGKKPCTTCRITPLGVDAFSNYIDALKTYINK